MFDCRVTGVPNKACWDCMYLESRSVMLYGEPILFECRLGGRCGNPLLRRCDMYKPGPRQVYVPLRDCRKCAHASEPKKVLGGRYCECMVGRADGNVYGRCSRCRSYKARPRWYEKDTE